MLFDTKVDTKDKRKLKGKEVSERYKLPHLFWNCPLKIKMQVMYHALKTQLLIDSKAMISIFLIS